MKSLRFFGSEFRAMLRSKDVIIPVLGLLVIPLLYSGIYLIANWDPYSNVKHMPVAVVNEDNPVLYEGREIAIGRELIQKLENNDAVDFHFVTREEAERGLSEHRYYLMILIPEQMSRHATTILDPNPEPLNLIYKENSSFNFLSGQISDKVVANIKAEMSQKVTETYVEQMFNAIQAVAEGLGLASDGAGQIESGLAELGNGIEMFRDELNKQVDDKTSEAGSLVEKLLEENRAKVDEKVHKEINDAIDKNKPALLDEIHGEIDKQSEQYMNIAHNTVHRRIDEMFEEYSGPAKEKLHEQIDKQSAVYGEQIRANMHQEIDQAYADNVDKIMKAIDGQIDKTLDSMEPVARAKMHDTIDREYAKIDRSIRDEIHRNIDEKVDQLFADAVQKGKERLQQIQTDFDQLEEKMKPLQDNMPPDLQKQWEDMKRKLEEVRTKVEQSLQPDQLEQLKGKLKQDLKRLADKELDKVGSALVAKLHETADAKFDELYPNVRSLAHRLAQSKANELAPSLLAKAHSFADEIYDRKSKELTRKLHQLVDDKWNEYEPKVANGVHRKADEELDRLAPEVVAKLHEAADRKVNDLEPKARMLLHNAADTKLNEAGSLIQQLMHDKMRSMIDQIDQAKNSINDGFGQLLDGQEKLLDGGGKLREKLEEGAEKATQHPTDKTYQMISSPVDSDKIENNDVTTYGVGMAPYFLSLGFFVGALMFSMVFPLRETNGRAPSGFAWFLSKFGVMAIEGLLQVCLAGLVILNLIGLPVKNVPMFFVTCLVTSLTFFALVQFFITAFGNVGRFIIILLLVFQLSSSAGTFPIELAPEFFQALHPWLPMTYTIRAFRGVISLGDMNYVWSNIGILSVYLILSLAASCAYFTLRHRSMARADKSGSSPALSN